ncbi:MAG: aminoglycoside/choline kinase family phosphotransferase, partial [Myxococcota bacterium]
MSSHWEKPREYTARAMKGGAGNRTYERIRAGDTSWVVMQLAEESIRSEEAMSGPTPTEVPFVEMQAFLSARGVPVPQIIHFDRELGQIWLEDLGDRQLLDALKAQPPSQWVEGYGPALDLLVAWQQGTASPGDDPPIAYARSFEPQLLRWELDHYREWRVEQQLGRTIDAETLAALGTAFDDLVTRIGAQPQILCHRDFQSTNIMMPPSGPVAIDFQDALMGSWTYDLVALL